MTDSTDLTPAEEPGRELAAVAPAKNDFAAMLDTMLQLATNERVDAVKFETFRKAANEQQDRAERREYYQDKAAALFEMPSIRKDSKIIIADKNDPTNPDKARVQGTFAKWADMQRAIYPILDAHNLRLTHKVDHEGTVVLVTPVLQHRNGFVEEGGQMALPLDTSGGKNNTQGAGSATQYGMRYTTVAMLGIRYEAGDDDGNLIALPDEPLNDQQARRVAEAEAAWNQGEEAFEVWFTQIPAIDRAWMIQTGRYKEITGKELGMLKKLTGYTPMQGASDQDPPRQGRPKQERNAGHDVSTAEGWTAQYEDDCKAAKSVDELAGIQQRGAKALARLKTNPDSKALFDRATKAGTDAYARLNPPEPGESLFEEGEG